MRDEYDRVQTYAQALREMNTGDMAQFISDLVENISGVKISNETVQEKLESLTEKLRYRVVIGEDKDDFIFASGLTYEDALAKKGDLTLKSGAYSYIEEDNPF